MQVLNIRILHNNLKNSNFNPCPAVVGNKNFR